MYDYNMEHHVVKVTNIFFQDPGSGFCAFKGIDTQTEEDIQASGTMIGAGVVVGDILEIKGYFFNHKTYGRQISIKQWRIQSENRSMNQFLAFLSSGAIKGIGPKIAQRIIKKFGDDTLNVFEKDLNKLLCIQGVTKKSLPFIEKSWHKVKHYHFLYSLGISARQVEKIIEKYGAEATAKIKENPYRLILDVEGVGFKRADEIATKLGIPKNSPFRIKAIFTHVLNESSMNGHCYLPQQTLIFQTRDLAEITKEEAELYLEEALYTQELYKVGDFVGTRAAVLAENYVSEKLTTLKGSCPLLGVEEIEQDCEFLSGVDLDDLQKQAIINGLMSKISVITGFPGSGKSLCTRTIVNILCKYKINFRLLAPTGRAAKRLSEVTGHPASTIHRFLIKLDIARGKFKGLEDYIDQSDDSFDPTVGLNESEYTVFIIDECSMIDIYLLRNLLPEINQHVIFIGDIDQLPSVGPGNVLKDMINSNVFPVTRLSKIFRQEEGSGILNTAFCVNKGKMPEIVDFRTKKADCSILPVTDSKVMVSSLVKIVTEILPKHYPQYDIKNDVQILTPFNKGDLGTTNLNTILQKELNKNTDGMEFLEHGPSKFYVGDKVIQTQNNYDKGVFNGDMGIVRKLYPEYDELVVEYPEMTVRYTAKDLLELKLGYSLSIHRTQGSEFPVVIMLLHDSHWSLLQRNLVYTGITRARETLILLSGKDTLWSAIRNNKIQQRNTLLCERLSGKV